MNTNNNQFAEIKNAMSLSAALAETLIFLPCKCGARFGAHNEQGIAETNCKGFNARKGKKRAFVPAVVA